jgi:CHASE3 domain sensor protein
MKRFALNRKTVFGLGVVLFLQLSLSIVASRNIVALMETNRQVAHSQEVFATLESLLSQAQDAEVERGFLLTGDDLFLAPYETARQAILPTLQRLRQLTTENPISNVRMATLESLVKQRLTLAQRVMEVQQAKGSEVAIRLAQSGRGQALMAEIHSLVEDLRSEEITELQQRQMEAGRNGRTALWVIVLSSVVALGFVAWVATVIHQDRSKRRSAERALLRVYTTGGEPRGENPPIALPAQGNGEVPAAGNEHREPVLPGRGTQPL